MESSNDHLTAFHRDGFFVTPQVLSEGALRWLDDGMARVVEGQMSGEAPDNGVAVCERDGRRFVTGISRLYDVLGTIGLYLLGHPAVCSAARFACGHDPVPTHDWMVIKNAGDGHAVGWHRDFVHDARHTAINIGVYLDEAGEDAVCFIPGSHRRSRRVAECAAGLDYDSPDIGKAVVPRGGLSVHNVLLVHGSPPIRQHQRRTMYIEFRSGESLENHPVLPQPYVELRRRLYHAARMRYAALGDNPVGPPPALCAEEREILAALDDMHVRVESADYGGYRP